MLLTDRRRSFGKILANTRHNARRARFSIAHELGHFLLESHELNRVEGFGCNRADMNERRAGTRQQKQEAEANRFAIDLLAPAYRLNPHLVGEPDLRVVLALGQELDISLEAAARRFIELHDEPLAAVMSKDNVVRYVERNERFPRINLKRGHLIAAATRAHRVIAAGKPGVTHFGEAHAAAWLDDSDVELFEQTRLGRDGFAMTLLWASSPDQVAEDDGVEELGDPGFPGRRRRRP